MVDPALRVLVWLACLAAFVDVLLILVWMRQDRKVKRQRRAILDALKR
jgi:hypothetical protein